ncbi:MAG: T9SS type A sorting domain-containing protein [candidate division KSB1 bacterium]|nr:T9SS type A sorting domain-containing protein [candidate division KSB1 bacterium]
MRSKRQWLLATLLLGAVASLGLTAPQPAGPIAVVAGAEGGVVQLIDLTNNTLIATIPVFDPASRTYGVVPFDVKVTPDGLWAYVSSAATHQVYVVNMVLQRIEAVLQVRHGPTEMAISPDGAFVYVSCSLSGYQQTEYISVIATKDHTVFHEIPTEVAPLGLAFTPDGSRVLVANPAVGDAAGGTVTIIDAATHTIQGSVALGGTPAAVAVHPEGQYAYITNTSAGAVMVLDLQATPPAVVATLELGALTTPTSIAIAPDGKTAQVTNSFMGMVTILDLTNPAAPVVGGQVAVGTLPTDVVYSFDGNFSYVTNTGSNTVSVIDNTAQPPAVATTIDLGDVHPRGIDIARQPKEAEFVFPATRELPRLFLWLPSWRRSYTWVIDLPVDPASAAEAELILTARDIDNVGEAAVEVEGNPVPLTADIVSPGWLSSATANLPLSLSYLVPGNNMVTINLVGSTDGFLIEEVAILLRFAGTSNALRKFSPPERPQTNVVPQMIESFLLAGNFPNPFNPSTTIDFQLPKDSRVSITIFNSNGQLIRTLVDGNLQAGAHQVQWDGLDDQGNHVAAGVYLCRMKAGDFMDTKRMLLVK